MTHVLVRGGALALVALAACAKDPPPRPAPPSGTTFTKAAPGVGQTREESSEIAMTMNGATSISRSKRIEKVLAVNGSNVAKVEVRFESVEPPSAIAGKTYVIDATAVTDATGKTAAEPDAKEVRKLYRTIGRADPIASALPATPLAPGDRVDALAKAIGEQMSDDAEGMKASDVAVTFAGVRGDVGVFDVSMKLVKTDPPVTMTIDAKGEAWVETKTAQTRKLDLKGPIAIAGGPMSGTGQMTMKLEGRAL